MKYAEFLERPHFTKAELLAFAHGRLVDDPPADFARLPTPPMLMFDRVVELVRAGNRGRIVAEQDVQLDAWFFHCHFLGDPVQPGCLGVDAVWQLLGFFMTASGSPGSGRALGCKEIEFSGQIRPHNKIVRYQIDVRRYSTFKDAGAALVIGDASVLVDGEAIYRIDGARVGIFLGIKYADYPNAGPNAVGGVMKR